MKWKETLATALVTLGITIIAGVAVNYATREPQKPPRAESIEFEADPVVAFETELTKLSLATVKIRNSGTEAAHGVIVGVQFAPNVRIVDKIVILSSFPDSKMDTYTGSNSSVETRIATLAPGESATMSILIDKAERSPPKVSVKSDRTLGRPTEHTRPEPNSPSIPGSIAGVVVPVALLIQILAAITLLAIRVVRVVRDMPIGAANNTAFVLLHKGLADEAHELLKSRVARVGADPFTLANYGLAVGLRGDHTKAHLLLDAAKFWADTDKHGTALCLFNRAIVHLNQGNEAPAIEALRAAAALSKKEILRYCQYSTPLTDLRKASTHLDSVLNEMGATISPK